MPPPCPHGAQPDLTLRRRVLMGAILRADATLLLRRAEVMPQRGPLPRAGTAEEPAPQSRAGVPPFVPVCAVDAWGVQVWGCASYATR